MPLEEQQKHYLTLTGDPLNKSVWQGVVLSSATAAPALMMAFVAATAVAKGGIRYGFAVAAAGLGAMALTYIHERSKNLKHAAKIFNESSAVLCIDKNPDEHVTTSKDNRYRSATMVADTVGAVAVDTAGLILCASFVYIARDSIPLDVGVGMVVTALASNMTTQLSCNLNKARSHNKVLNGEWVIAPLPQDNSAPQHP